MTQVGTLSKRLSKKLTEDNHILNIQIKNPFPQEVSNYKLIGIIINLELAFDNHVESMLSKLAQLIGVL